MAACENSVVAALRASSADCLAFWNRRVGDGDFLCASAVRGLDPGNPSGRRHTLIGFARLRFARSEAIGSLPEL
jgi:hypothetical protein